MEEENVVIRLKGFIDSEGLTHSQFADRCEIPRPSLSQLLSGRNKKISDVLIRQIHRAFPRLSVSWLLFGEGPMLQGMAMTARDQGDTNGSVTTGDSLFDFSEGGISGSDSGNGDSFGINAGQNPDPRLGKVENGSDKLKNAYGCTEEFEYSNVNALNNPSKALQIAEQQLVEAENKIAELQTQIDKMRANPRKVTQITVYYDDSTFETFYPASGKLVN